MIEQDLLTARGMLPERISPDQAVRMLNQAALQNDGWYLYSAPQGGNGAWLGKKWVRCDILSNGGHHYDVLRDGPDAHSPNVNTGEPPYLGEAEIVWQDKGPADPGRLVSPLVYIPTPGSTPGPTPTPPHPGPSPLPPHQAGYWGDERGTEITTPLFLDYARAGQAPNPGMGVWMGRTMYDVLVRGEAFESALTRHRAEWCAILGIPVTPLP